MEKYDHKKIEKKWQEVWEAAGLYHASDKNIQPKFYPLIEFPYPSGAGLHVGHPRPYIGMDIIARKRRMQGYNVLYPIGWDAFGLPTENYAIKTGRPPAEITEENTATFRRQIQSLGISFDWSREITTSDPRYYKWTQWIFLKLYEKGLAYKSRAAINWCPKDKIGLANEEVVDGRCERCGTLVEKREREQWMLAITKYADRLDRDLDDVDYLPKIKIQQRNWIGRSEGAELSFPLCFAKNPAANDNRGPHGEKPHITVFTTRPDTLFGATYLVLSPEHPWLVRAIDDRHDVLENREEVKAYAESAKERTEIERTAEGKEKTGVELRGVNAINPATEKKIPIFVADYVLGHYGTGAIMAVPAHDERDFEFAKKFGLPVKKVIEPVFTQTTEPGRVKEELPFEHRDAIIAIVKHWSKDAYIGLKWKEVAWGTFITGGIEAGQTPEQAARMEIREETGFTDARLIKDFGRVHGKFYHVPKKVNRFAHSQVLFFKLQSGAHDVVSEKEKAIHEVVWLSADELKKFLTADSHHHALRMLMDENTLFTGEGWLVNSGDFNGMDSEKARHAITEFVGGERKVTYTLRDWVFSRQRYWGEPIPMIYCESGKHGWVPVPEKELPVVLPEISAYTPSDTGESPLAALPDWVQTICPVCGGPAMRETDTMPNWAGSSWYYLRYTDPKNNQALASREALDYWIGGLPRGTRGVDWYNGGMEHTTLHLLYSRFWHKFLYDLGIVPTHEPYAKRTSHGLILAKGGEKMSKSKGNVVNPDTIVESVGADTLRVYEMFMGPFDQAIAWSADNMVGARRFLEKVWEYVETWERNYKKDMRDNPNNFELYAQESLSEMIESELHKMIKSVSEDIEEMKFNTAVSAMMIFLNIIRKELPAGFTKSTPVTRLQLETFLILLAPFAPHMAEELWSKLGHTESIHIQPWPEYDEAKTHGVIMTIAVQINGKVRDFFGVARDSTEKEIIEQVLALPKVHEWIGEKTVMRVIHVPGKLVNIVT